MTQKTLKQIYDQRKLVEVKNKLQIIDENLIKNNPDYQLAILFEALDEKEYAEVTEVINKLNKINAIAKKGELDFLSGACDQVIKSINDYAGAGALGKLASKAKSLFSREPGKNPILAGLGMVETLEAGFKILPTIIKNNIPDVEKDAEMQKKKLSELIQDDDKIKKNVESALRKAFTPAGKFAKIFNQKLPGFDDPEFLMKDLLGATPLVLGEIANILRQGPPASEIDTDLANPEKAGEGGGKPGEKQTELTPQQQKVQLVAVQNAAKDAGITEEETVTRFLSTVMGWKEGVKHPYSDTAIEVLKKYALNKKVAKGQLDGFVDGISVDSNKVRKEIQTLVSQAEEKKAAEEAKKGAGKEATGTEGKPA